ncbi:Large subunit GTPase 1 [Schistosoma japonicum]|nr:Large subunit GTPase 1 [Schistosoma japonicum]
MGKKHGLGRSLVKQVGSVPLEKSGRHIVGSCNAEDWSRLPVHSVTEQTGLDEFFSIAKLANQDFKAQKKNIRFLTPSEITGIPSISDRSKISEVQKLYKNFLKIPRS